MFKELLKQTFFVFGNQEDAINFLKKQNVQDKLIYIYLEENANTNTKTEAITQKIPDNAQKIPENPQKIPEKPQSKNKVEYIELTQEIEFIFEQKNCGILDRIEKNLKIKCEIKENKLYNDVGTREVKEKIIGMIEEIKYLPIKNKLCFCSPDFLENIPRVKNWREYDIFIKYLSKDQLIIFTDNDNANLDEINDEICDWHVFSYNIYSESTRKSGISSEDESKRLYLERIVVPSIKTKIIELKEKEILDIYLDSNTNYRQEDTLKFLLKKKNEEKQKDIISKLSNTFKDLTYLQFSIQNTHIMERLYQIYFGKDFKEIEHNMIIKTEMPNTNNRTHFLHVYGEIDSIIDYLNNQLWPYGVPHQKFFCKLKIDQTNISSLDQQEMRKIIDEFYAEKRIVNLMQTNNEKKQVQFDVYLDDIPVILDPLFPKNNGKKREFEVMEDKPNYKKKDRGHQREHPSKVTKSLKLSSQPLEVPQTNFLNNLWKADEVRKKIKNDNAEKRSWEETKLSDNLEKLLTKIGFASDSIDDLRIEEYFWNYHSKRFNDNIDFSQNPKDAITFGYAKPLGTVDSLVRFIKEVNETSFECAVHDKVFEVGENLEKPAQLAFYSDSEDRYFVFILILVKYLHGILDFAVRPFYQISFKKK